MAFGQFSSLRHLTLLCSKLSSILWVHRAPDLPGVRVQEWTSLIFYHFRHGVMNLQAGVFDQAAESGNTGSDPGAASHGDVGEQPLA